MACDTRSAGGSAVVLDSIPRTLSWAELAQTYRELDTDTLRHTWLPLLLDHTITEGHPLRPMVDALLIVHQRLVHEQTEAKADESGPRIGESHPRATITEDDVRRIRAMHADGWNQREIAAAMSLQPNCVSKIVLRKTWRHVA